MKEAGARGSQVRSQPVLHTYNKPTWKFIDRGMIVNWESSEEESEGQVEFALKGVLCAFIVLCSYVAHDVGPWAFKRVHGCKSLGLARCILPGDGAG